MLTICLIFVLLMIIINTSHIDKHAKIIMSISLTLACFIGVICFSMVSHTIINISLNALMVSRGVEVKVSETEIVKNIIVFLVIAVSVVTGFFSHVLYKEYVTEEYVLRFDIVTAKERI